MLNDDNSHTFKIKIKGHLMEGKWDWLDEFSLVLSDDGCTVLIGNIIDQAALHGLLKKFRDLGIELISINRFDSE